MDKDRKKRAMKLFEKLQCNDVCLKDITLCPHNKRCEFLLSLFSTKI